MVIRYSVDTRSLKIAMVSAGFDSNAAFARVAKISNRTVSSTLRGKNPTYLIMSRMTMALKLTPQQAARIFFADKLLNV